MQIDAFGRVFDSEAPETVDCTACGGTAEYLSSAWQGEGIAYHNYQCHADNCPAGGTLVEHERGHDRRVGPVFGDRDLAIRLATRDRPEVPAEAREVRA
jgi:hypothetical protein